MKNNDFDFIKHKFEKAQPELPHNLDKEIIEQKILSKDEHRAVKFKQNNGYFKSVLAAAACFILILGAVFSANTDIFNSNKVASFGNYDEFNSKISTLRKIPPQAEGGSGEFKSVKYIEEDGVEEPDTIKSVDNYIFYAYYDHNNANGRNKVYIYKTADEKSELVSVINNFITDDYCIEDLFADENRLVVNASTDSKTVTQIYDISDKTSPALISEFEQSGKYSESRIVDKTLYIVTNYNVLPNGSENSLPYVKQNGETAFSSAKDISFFEDVKIARYVVINTIDIVTGKQSANLKAVLGGSENIYFTKDCMYSGEYIEEEDNSKFISGNTSAIKINLKNNKISYATKKEADKYLNFSVDIGKGDNYSNVIYSAGEYLLSIGENVEQSEEEIILLDKNLKQLDSKTFNKTHISATLGSLAISKEKNIYAVPAYFTDETKRCYSVVTFEIKNNQIVITNEFINNDTDLMYQGNCIIIGDYLYSFNIDDTSPDNQKLKVFSYKY